MLRIIVSLLLLLSISKAQNCLKQIAGGACIVLENDKYGVKKKDKYIVPAYFEELMDYSNKYIAVAQHNQWGLFSIKGQLLLDICASLIKPIDAERGLIYAETNKYHGLILTEKIFIPENAHKVNSFLASSANEVTVAQYMMFMIDIKNNPPKEFTYEMSFPDTSQMAKNTAQIFTKYLMAMNNDCREKFDVLFMKSDFDSKIPCEVYKDKTMKQYLNMPMTGITFKQAQRYCNWMSDKMNQQFTIDSPYEMIVRLPKPLEWEEMAIDGLEDAQRIIKSQDSLNAKKCLLFNYAFKKEACSQTEDQIKLFGNSCVPAWSYNPDLNGIYNLFGNVAEMTTDEGIAKGGSFMHVAKLARADQQLEYHKSQPWLGFRWVIEYRVKK